MTLTNTPVSGHLGHHPSNGAHHREQAASSAARLSCPIAAAHPATTPTNTPTATRPPSPIPAVYFGSIGDFSCQFEDEIGPRTGKRSHQCCRSRPLGSVKVVELPLAYW